MVTFTRRKALQLTGFGVAAMAAFPGLRSRRLLHSPGVQ